MNLRKWILISVLLGFLTGCNNSWSSGDRVLVSKMQYGNGFTHPNRYDVVVFKYPDGPVDRNTPKNYIKRLLGLPGEIIAIFFGRLYHMPAPKDGKPYFDDLNQLDANGQKTDPNDLWKKRRPNADYTHTDDAKARKWFEEGKFEILRKPPSVMLALRRIVYDNDYQAKDLKGKLDRWNPPANSGWKTDEASEQRTGFVFEGKANDTEWIHYQHLLHDWGRDVPHGGMKVKPELITNEMDYNNGKTQRGGGGTANHWVGDLMIECDLQVLEPKGEFVLELSKGLHRYQATWDLGTGQCTLSRVLPDGKSESLGSAATSVKSAGTYTLRLANIDARLTVWVDRSLPFGDGKNYDPPEMKMLTGELKEWGPTKENDLDRPASIGGKGSRVKVAHLRVWRDTYYITRIGGHSGNTDYDHDGAMPTERDADGGSAWGDPKRWTPIRGQRFGTMYVQPGHYLCLGDNSAASSDSRDWGLVPERLMLGRALVVYFPLERMGPIR